MKYIGVVLVLLCRSVWAVKWTTQEVTLQNTQRSELNANPDDFINVTVSDHKICKLDRLTVTWNAGRASHIENLGLAYVKSSDSATAVGSYISLLDTETASPLADSNVPVNQITCDINEIHCVPKISSIRANFNSNKLVLEFESTVVQAELANATAVLDALDISPTVRFPQMSGEWTAPGVLEIQLDSFDMESILNAHKSGQKIDVSVRKMPRTSRSGLVTVRPSDSGAYHIVVVDRNRDMLQLPQHLASVQSVVVELCDDATVLPSTSTTSTSLSGIQRRDKTNALSTTSAKSAWNSGVARPIVSIQGPSAVTGQDALTFSDRTVDPEV